ncbi:hypothetical protein H112_07585 [Trichophyton rubrum D6]|uniref:Phosphatidylinositol N-acetylglucosaminyltransferase subunit H conserved domain-containing protein n=3 Tax=Trichophyton TaxID=5550 RepID=F2SEA8_TRIRC|nr:uncharacterized protein TERG_00186 [Trichophyton rubrum CBS 118892]EZF11297.1 hypothetical protein H100_07612 [Trichophyton rubrum MR850]EZF38224.1 hypothetical protein H102_07576 [Trichophyton rubrum CBS 100081]EZF48776.1 hypothetical protein H103_07598 [Trichophyton rubrum CBS 288.86]EZF59365.1 hypothetical protein H104_07547 [Trichophyton rubrum CBS 289.86]EZF70079.1 hypothetical protein H105_07602 [Trichophyton soudanense CBS 452.61]EZF80698.1 hypothetical protein H110_07595 [Trichophy
MPPHLKTYSPSSTTVQFTVSNAAPRSTIASKIIFYVGIIIRIVIFALVILVDTATCRNHIPDSWTTIPWDTIWTSSIGLIACNTADAYMWQGIAACSALLLYFVARKGYTDESLLVIRGLGVQTSTSSATYFPSATTRFIPTTQIQDIVIHEAFRGFEVRYYLAIIVDGESDVVVVFPNLLPKRMIVEEVWKGARKCLYESSS